MDTLITDVVQFRVSLGVPFFFFFAIGAHEHSTVSSVSLCLGRQKLGGRPGEGREGLEESSYNYFSMLQK